MTTDAQCVEVNIDYSNVAGYFVSLDVEIPKEALNGQRADGGPMGSLRLGDGDAEHLAHELLQVAARVRELREAPG